MVNLDQAPVAPPWLAARGKPYCLLCSGPTAFTNIYIPGERSSVKPPPGKGRMVIYSLCESCARNFHALSDLIETKIENELHSAGAI